MSKKLTRAHLLAELDKLFVIKERSQLEFINCFEDLKAHGGIEVNLQIDYDIRAENSEKIRETHYD